MTASIARTQREILVCLISLADEQEFALAIGDLVALNDMSELRLQIVRETASFVPPLRAWAPENKELVEMAKQTMSRIQQSIRACMAVVRRQRADFAA
jgi:hypothetical protein